MQKLTLQDLAALLKNEQWSVETGAEKVSELQGLDGLETCLASRRDALEAQGYDTSVHAVHFQSFTLGDLSIICETSLFFVKGLPESVEFDNSSITEPVHFLGFFVVDENGAVIEAYEALYLALQIAGDEITEKFTPSISYPTIVREYFAA